MEKAFQDLLLRRMDKQDEKLERILVQATKTNGRVTTTEAKVEVVEMVVEELQEIRHYNRGRDRVLWIIAGAGVTAIATVAGIIITHFVSKT